jgi:hypothetical protein
MKSLASILFSIALVLSACAPGMDDPAGNDDMDKPVSSDDPSAPQTGGYLPQPGDSALQRENAYATFVDLLVMESYPLQFMLILKGDLPTPCNQLRVDVRPPDAENRIMVEVYSVIEPDIMCAQVIQPFEINVPLGSFPAGTYTIWVNGALATQFDA